MLREEREHFEEWAEYYSARIAQLCDESVKLELEYWTHNHYEMRSEKRYWLFVVYKSDSSVSMLSTDEITDLQKFKLWLEEGL
jgi:hypothetical protein